MTRLEAQIETFNREFPRLLDYINPANIDSLMVSRVDTRLLELHPIHPETASDWSEDVPPKQVYLVDDKGQSLAHVGYDSPRPDPTCQFRKYRGIFFWKGKGFGSGDTTASVCKTWKGLGSRRSKVKYLYVLYPMLKTHGIGGPKMYGSYAVVVYKLPHGFTIDEWIIRLYGNAHVELRNQIAEVDRV